MAITPDAGEDPGLLTKLSPAIDPDAGIPYSLVAAPLTYVGDVPFTCTSIPATASWLIAGGGRGQAIRLANAYSVALAHQDAEYRTLLCGPGVNLPDGTPISWVMRLRDRSTHFRPKRVRGPSLFAETLRASQGTPARHFLLGGTPETMAGLLDHMAAHYPGATVAGWLTPAFGPLDEGTIDAWAGAITATDATIVWVSLGTPKQDFAAARLAQRTGLNCLGVGAAFDFLAGTQREAPVWMQRFAAEWLFRLVTQPRRLWRRYLIGNVQFVQAVVKAPRVIDLRDRPSS